MDNRGTQFNSTVTAAFDPANGINSLSNDYIVNELRFNRPLLYTNTHHAMVNYGVTFQSTPFGVRVNSVLVVDPWPPNPRTHPLTLPEMVPSTTPVPLVCLQAK